ncbi:MAG: DUF5606 domain-containing protein [Bacteroidota bacterium]
MKLDQILAVSGLPGLYTVVTERKNGLIVEALDTNKRRFAPMRKHQFAPLESMAVYTDDGEAEPLTVIFQRMLDQAEDNPAPAANASKEVLFEYLSDILPNYDEDRVHASDIKRLLKWFHFIDGHQLWSLTADTQEEE